MPYSVNNKLLENFMASNNNHFITSHDFGGVRNLGWAVLLLLVALTGVTWWYSGGSCDGLEGLRWVCSYAWSEDGVTGRLGSAETLFLSGLSQGYFHLVFQKGSAGFLPEAQVAKRPRQNLPEPHFLLILLIKWATGQPRFKGKGNRLHLCTGGVAKNLEPCLVSHPDPLLGGGVSGLWAMPSHGAESASDGKSAI